MHAFVDQAEISAGEAVVHMVLDNALYGVVFRDVPYETSVIEDRLAVVLLYKRSRISVRQLVWFGVLGGLKMNVAQEEELIPREPFERDSVAGGFVVV